MQSIFVQKNGVKSTNDSLKRCVVSIDCNECFNECVCDSLCIISGGCIVALKQRLHEEPQSSHHTHQDEDPQEQTVYHHGYVLPVLYDLEPNQQG